MITALNDIASGKKDANGIYVPYRDSKLTCLLRQSIGGNAFCCMIACLHPSDIFFTENYSTLTYAARAGAISNRPVKNDDPKTKQIEELKSHVKILTSELLKANQHIEFLSRLTGQKIERFGSPAIIGKYSGSGVAPSMLKTNPTSGRRGSDAPFKASILSQNAAAYINGNMSASKKSDTKPFLPKINDKSSASNYSGHVQMAQETPPRDSTESQKLKDMDE